MTEQTVLLFCTYAAFLLTVLPLFFGGKVYNSLKAIMSVKIVYVLVFLTFLAVCFSTRGHLERNWHGAGRLGHGAG